MARSSFLLFAIVLSFFVLLSITSSTAGGQRNNKQVDKLSKGRRLRPKSPKMYMIKCCGANSSCLYRSSKKKPPDWSYLQNSQSTSAKTKANPTNTPIKMKQTSTNYGASAQSKIENTPENIVLTSTLETPSAALTTQPIIVELGSSVPAPPEPSAVASSEVTSESTKEAKMQANTSQTQEQTTDLSTTVSPTTTASATTASATTTSTSTSTTTTTTTTTTPSCVNTCDAIKSDSTNSLLKANTTGKYFKTCGRTYFVTQSTGSVSFASSLCLSMNMSLLVIDSIAELLCLYKLIPKDFKLSNFITSASNEGVMCDAQQGYSWCSQNTKLIPDLVKGFLKPATNASHERCLAFNASSSTDNSSALTHTSCANDQLPYICEPPCAGPACPAPASCAKNASLFGADGKVKEPKIFGVWMETCGDTYLFGNKPVSWDQNWQTCCSLGMEPLIIDSSVELKCLSDVTKNGTWTGNFNYWTGGTQKDCRGSWSWCGKGGAIAFNDGVAWEKDQPDNKGGREDCIHLKLKKNATGQPQEFLLTDRNCTDKYVLACKGNPSRPEVCTSLSCSLVSKPKPCARKSSLFSSGKLLNFDTYGNWIGGCGKFFMFSNDKANWTTAIEKCCSIGLTLAAIPTMGKKKCMDKMIDKMPEDIFDDFWVYGTDNGCSPGNMHWCSDYKQFQPKEVTWAAGEPSNKGSCVYMKSSNSSSLATADCSTEMRFLCDVRKKGTTGMAMQQECMETWNVTPTELDALTNISVDITSLGLNVKCFVKCMGEFAGMFALGGLVPGDMLRMIEEAANDDPVEIQSGFNAYDECSSIKYDDECVTAAEMYSCGREKEPGLVDIMLNSEKGNATIYEPPIPCLPRPRGCQYSKSAPPCIPDAALQKELMDTNKTSMGRLVYMPTMSKSAFLSIKSTTASFAETWSYCCSIGMKPLEYSNSQYQEVIQKLAIGNGIVSMNTRNLVIGETDAFNKTHERWCRSKELVAVNLVITNTCTDAFLFVLSAYEDSSNGEIIDKYLLSKSTDVAETTRVGWSFACV